MYYTGQPKIMITDFKPLKPNFRQVISTVLKTESTVRVDVLTHADRCVCAHCVCVCMCVLYICY